MEIYEDVDGNASEPKAKSGRARRKPGVKTPALGTGKRSLNLRIDDDSYQKLNVHALMRNKTVSELVMEFAQSLKEFSIHRNPSKNAGQG
jgi:hypothetical protein